jgi:hypothetical protein
MKGGQTMKRGPYVLIGVLIGIIVMQWAMPVAHGASIGQIPDNVIAKGFTLVNDAGEITARLYNRSDGPTLTLGGTTGPSVTIGLTHGSAFVWVDGGDLDNSASMIAGPTYPARLVINTEGEGGGVQVNAAETGSASIQIESGNSKIEMATRNGWAGLVVGKGESKTSISHYAIHSDLFSLTLGISPRGLDLGGQLRLYGRDGTTTFVPPLQGVATADRPATWGQVKKFQRDQLRE